MELRPEIEPQMIIAKKLYPGILNLVYEYGEFIDENGNEDEEEYQKIEEQIGKIIKKDVSHYNLYETAEEEGSEVLSFKLSLPDPLPVKNITPEELHEIVHRLKDGVSLAENEEDGKDEFESQFGLYLDDYYHQFLALNFKKYRHNYFTPQKDGREFTVDEIVKKIM